MRIFVECIGKELEVEDNRTYRIVTLINHEGINVPNLKKEEFVQMMKSDLRKAQELYNALMAPEMEEYHQRLIQSHIEQAVQYANSKWKTQKRRDEYIETERKAAENIARPSWDTEMFWDFKPEVGNIIPGVCILTPNEDDVLFERCYEEWIKSPWWQHGHGWVLKYDCHTKSFRSSARPWIELMMDDEATEERKRQQQNIDNDIARFYTNCRYCGD